jgi:hypothetical protein
VQATLALAEEFHRELESGVVNRADLARQYGVTRARVTQVLNIPKLHPVILSFLRTFPRGPHARLYTERRVRSLVHLEPLAQLRAASAVLPHFAPAGTDQRTA